MRRTARSRISRGWARFTLPLTIALALGGGGAAQATPPQAATRPATSRPVDPIAHDPTMAKEGGYHYMVITGDSGEPDTYLPMKRSKDLVHWEDLGPVFGELPAWVIDELGTTPKDAWAPELARVNEQWALYYAASQFATQNSVIGLATTPTLDPDDPDFGWTDRGLVLRSTQGAEDFNAIDPEHVTDAEGRTWLAFGSFWGGLKMRRLDPVSGKLLPGDTTVHSLSSRPAPDAQEGPSIVRHGDHYYLFLSFDYCCRGLESDYRTMVGRADSITGPYVDRDGVRLTAGGGTEVLRGYNEFVGTGGSDVYVDGRSTYLVNHYYDATDGDATPRLNVRPVSWKDGWPVVGDPLNPSRSAGHGDAYLKLVERSTGRDVANAGCGLEGAAIALATAATAPACQQWQFGHRGDGTNRLLNRYSNQVAEVSACDNREGGKVAQWGWIGFLENNDCQRWTTVPTSGGWTTVQSVLTGSRVLDLASCAGGPDGDVVIRTRDPELCQEFRFEPAGPVLVIDQDDPSGVLGGPACRSASKTSKSPEPPSCRSWRFTSAGGAEYTLAAGPGGRPLGVETCGNRPASQPQLLGSARPGCRHSTRWTLVPANDGTWTLALTGTPVSRKVTLHLP